MELAWSCCCFFFLFTACARALRRLMHLPVLLCCEAMAWALAFLAFPLRMLAAVDVDRERKLGWLVSEMQAQMEELAWQNAALEGRLRAALREQEALEALLDEVEDQHDDAVARIHALETQLKALRLENMRLNEHKGKSKWDKPADRLGISGGSRASEPGKKPAKRGRGEEDAASSSSSAAAVGEELAAAAKHASPASALALAAEASPVDDALATVVAMRRSLFSLGMSLAVGGVAWSADAPCLPLLAGLFAVVGVSMRSVSRLRRAAAGSGPVGDAVALLSLNWFLLGLLTSPMLPGVAHAVVPRAGRALGPALAWLAAAAPL